MCVASLLDVIHLRLCLWICIFWTKWCFQVKRAFTKERSFLKNSLRPMFPEKKILAALEACKMNASSTAIQLKHSQFVALYHCLRTSWLACEKSSMIHRYSIQAYPGYWPASQFANESEDELNHCFWFSYISTLATFLCSFTFVFGHCMSLQLTGTIGTPVRIQNLSGSVVFIYLYIASPVHVCPGPVIVFYKSATASMLVFPSSLLSYINC